MEDKSSIAFESINNNHSDEPNHGWQKVSYVKKSKKTPVGTKAAGTVGGVGNGSVPNGGSNVFKSLEKHAEERRRKIEAQRAAIYDSHDGFGVRSTKHQQRDYDEDEDSDFEGVKRDENGGVDEKKKKEKVKKPKKPKVSVAEAAAKIDAADLAAFLADVTESYQSQQEIQLMRFTDYFGRAFSAVSASQFPWLKLFRESPVAKIADVPVSHISETVYKTSVDWINQRSYEALGSFVLWALDSILADLAAQQGGVKGSKKVSQQTSSKSQVAMFVVLSMVLRRKPDALISVLPTLKESSKYQGQDKLPVIVWMIVQASQGDLAVGLYLWAHHTLPLLGGKLSSNPQSRDLVLQLVERILSAPKARTILVNSAVRKGERLMPPSALDILLHVTFPASSSRVKATERFQAIYPILKEVALAGAPGSKAMKQVSQQILAITLKAAGEGIPELSKEASSISIWCFSQSPDCYKQWDKIYTVDIEASVAVLRKLCEGWKEFSAKQSSKEALVETLKNFRQKNEEALTGGADAAHLAVFKEADKYSKVLLGRLARGYGCLKALVVVGVAVAVGAAVMSPDIESWDWNKVSALFNPQKSL